MPSFNETPSFTSHGSALSFTQSKSVIVSRSNEIDPHSAFDFHFHIAVVGNVGVGKTQFLQSEMLSQQQKSLSAAPPLVGDFTGIQFKSCVYQESVSLKNEFRDDDDSADEPCDYRVKVTYWDVPGHQATLELSCSLVSAVAGIVYIADVTNPVTFSDLKVWILGIEKHQPLAKIIVGNKCDLKTTVPGSMSIKKGNAFAEKLNAFYYETSSLNNNGVSHCLSVLRAEILQRVNNCKVLQLRNNIFHNRIEIGEVLLGRYARLPRVEPPLPAECTIDCDWLE